MMLHTSGCRIGLGVSLLVVLAVGCTRPGDRVDRHGDEIVAAGQLFHTGTRVVLWTDPKGYDAYRARQHFDPSKILPRSPSSADDPNRYGPRAHLPEAL